MKVHGDPFKIGGYKYILGNIFQLLQVVSALVCIFSNFFTQMLGFSDFPTFINKMYALLILFLLFQRLIVCARASGAFEIWVDGRRVWSKLKTGTMPDTDELNAIFSDVGVTFDDFANYR